MFNTNLSGKSERDINKTSMNGKLHIKTCSLLVSSFFYLSKKKESIFCSKAANEFSRITTLLFIDSKRMKFGKIS